MNDSLNELKSKYDSLDEVEKIANRVLAYADKLKSKTNLTNSQKLWLLAYEAVNVKFAPGTEEAMLEASKLLPVLDATIETN